MVVNNNLVNIKCPFCGSDGISKVGEIKYFKPLQFSTNTVVLKNTPELWKCIECKSGFTQNAIIEQEAAKLYESGVGGERWFTKPFDEEKSHEIIKVIDEILLPGGNLLDIGCNTGELLDYAHSRGCITSGVEYSKSSRAVAENNGHKCFTSIDEVEGEYDVITAFDLLEHLYNVPLFIEKCKNMLTNKGSLVLFTGNFSCASARFTGSNWWYVRFPEHIAFASEDFFKNILGFSITKLERTYASVNYRAAFLYKLYFFIKGILRGNYAAHWSFSPDHVLVVLKKCEPV